MREAVNLLQEAGKDVGCLHVTDIWPFPVEAISSALKNVGHFLMVEQNATAQFGRLIREQTGLAYAHAVLKYDGRPLIPREIVENVTAFMESLHGNH